jgi:hypothetical protein
VVIRRAAQVELLEDLRNVRLDGFGGQEQRLADRAVGVALGDQLEYVALAVGQLVERTALALASNQARDDRGVDHALAIVDAPQRVGEHGEIRHPLLQKVARPCGRLLEQPHRVARLQVVREDEDADLGVPAADLLRGDEAVVAAVGWHADVHQSDVGSSSVDHPQQRLGVATTPRDLEAGVLEQASQALAQQHLVVRDHDSHGSSTRR